MHNPLRALEDAVAQLRAAWIDPGAADETPVGDLGRARLMAVVDGVAAVGRRLDAIRAALGAEVARESRVELGPDSLAKQHGYRNPAALMAATAGTSIGDATRLIKVGEATAARMTFDGTTAPARHSHIARALADGELTAQAAGAIISLLDRVALRCERTVIAEAERALCAQAAGLTVEQLAKVLTRAEACLDPTGVRPREQELRSKRGLRLFERDGMVHLTATLDPETAAPVKTVISALVTAGFRAAEGALDGGDEGDPDIVRRTLPQRQADALSVLAAHYLGCADADQPLAGVTVVVRVDEGDLRDGTGCGLIDGIDQPVSIETVRRMAAGGAVLPWVMGGQSQILDWGREKRLFTRAQRLALVERDGGCAMCGCDPGLTRVHHLRWWWRDQGRSDLDNGVLLCDGCHHRVHENGWEILVEGEGVHARVWFVPPPQVDPARRRRLGGRARYDYLAS